QQRLTALNIGLKGWYADKLPYYAWANDNAFPRRILHLNLLDPPADDMEFAYEFKMLREKDLQTDDSSKFWFPVGEILKFKEIPEVYDYCHDHVLTSVSKFPPRALMRLWEVVTKVQAINYF